MEGEEEIAKEVIEEVVEVIEPDEEVETPPPAEPVAEDPCDEVIQKIVDTAQKLEHDPDCPLYARPAGKKTKGQLKGKSKTKFQSKGQGETKMQSKGRYDPNSPCPPGVRVCCTCGVCPLDELDRLHDSELDTGASGGSVTSSQWGASSDLWGSSEGAGSHGTTSSERRRRDEGMGGERIGEGGWGLGSDYDHRASWLRRHHKDGSEGGGFFEDYMKFFIEPMEICYKTLSSISSSFVSEEETGLQRTIVLVKPAAVAYKEAIYRVIFEAGFQILGLRVVHLTPEQVSEFYSKHYGSPSFVHLVVSVSDAPVLAVCISAMNVIRRWLNLIGPDGSLRAEWFYPLSMRKLFGLVDTHAEWIHGSENLRESNKENRFFYPRAIIEPIMDDLERVTDYCQLMMNTSIVDACVEVVRKRPSDPIIFFADYLLLNNPFQPRLPKYIAFTPT